MPWLVGQDQALERHLASATRVSRRRRLVPVVLLTGILAAQAFMCVQLLHLDTAFSDEALYLWAGHLDWAHLINGTPIPPFATYLSGSPVLYPPVGAIADSIGGLTGARVLSLLFMLACTSFLWLTARRLYGLRAAFFATALWAFVGETLRLGAFATYDPMACMLLTLAAYAGVRAAQSDDHGPHWAMLSAAALAAANCTKYATALFDPAIVGLIVAVALTVQPDRKRAFRLGGIAGGYLAIILSTLIVIATTGNGYYSVGIAATTTSRASAGQTAMQVISTAWPVIEVVGPIALLGAVLCLWLERGSPQRLVIILLALTGALAPLNQVRIHTSTSLNKHTDFGAWFMAIAAGYAISALSRGRYIQRAGVAVAALAAVVVTVIFGIPFARFADSYWPNTTRVVDDAKPLLAHAKGEVLFQNPSIIDYDLGGDIGWTSIWKRVSGQSSLRLPSGKTVDDAPVGSDGIPGPYMTAIRRGYFEYVVLNNDPADSFDAKVIPVLIADPQYRLLDSPPGFFVWAHVPRVRR